MKTETGLRRIVVAGAGFAGLGAAYTLRAGLPEAHITVVDPSDTFIFFPSLVRAVFAGLRPKSTFSRSRALSTRGIDFIRSHVRQVDVKGNFLNLDDTQLPYDILVVATGGSPDAESVPGLAGEFRASSFLVGLDSAEEASRVLKGVYSSPGPIVVGVAQGATYISGVYELALGIHDALQKRGLRESTPLTFVTWEPYLGHLGFGQDAARRPLETMFRARDIEFRTGVQVDKATREKVVLSSGESLAARALFLMPSFTGNVDIWKSHELTDEKGLVPVNGSYRHIKHENVYAAGVAAVFDQPVAPLNTSQAPHTGYLSLRMGKIAGQNAAASLGAAAPAERTFPHNLDVRLVDCSNGGLLLMSRGDRVLRHRAVRLPGSTSRYLKSVVERILTWQMSTGHV